MSPADRARAASAERASVERDTDAPRRQTPTERLHEVTMAAMSRPAAPPESSVSFTRNAKGVTQIEVTVRDADASVAYDVAYVLFTAARTKFPLPSGYVGAEGEPQSGGAK